ncbi:hypothetical protein ABIE58_000811 [Roseovarius sp. MBR-78]
MVLTGLFAGCPLRAGLRQVVDTRHNVPDAARENARLLLPFATCPPRGIKPEARRAIGERPVQALNDACPTESRSMAGRIILGQHLSDVDHLMA